VARRAVQIWILFGLALGCSTVAADDLSGSDRWLCAATLATRSYPDGECLTAAPGEWNIPDFIVVDLEKKQLTTTPASGQNRATPIKDIERADETVFIQGFEGGRAFGIAVATKTGELTFTVVTDGAAIGGFGVCTALPVEN
jgi:hypothetical protein